MDDFGDSDPFLKHNDGGVDDDNDEDEDKWNTTKPFQKASETAETSFIKGDTN